MLDGHLDTKHGGPAAETHRPNSELVDVRQQTLLKCSQRGILIGVVQRAQENLFGPYVARSAITT
jgi:hypothetical protein